MFDEALILQKAIRQLIRFEEGKSLNARNSYQLARQISAWQDQYDTEEELFPMPYEADMTFPEFMRDLWPDARESIGYFGEMMERAFNMCLAKIEATRPDDSNAIQILFSIHPNLVLEKYALEKDIDPLFLYSEQEVDYIHEIMTSRLESMQEKMNVLNFLKETVSQLKQAGLNIHSQFKRIERKIQDTLLIENNPEELFLTTEPRKIPALTVLDGGLSSPK